MIFKVVQPQNKFRNETLNRTKVENKFNMK